MATFTGTYQEFHNHIGPRIRNIINSYCRKERKARNGICEECYESGHVLESAHVHGKGRRTIIESVLKNYSTNNIVTCDLLIAEREIILCHEPISDTFKFLCKKCHRAYDNSARTTSQTPPPSRAPRTQQTHKVEIFFEPNNEADFKKALIECGQAHVRLLFNDGRAENFLWNAQQLKTTSNLRGNIFSGYLRNWSTRGIHKAVFSIAPISEN